MNDSSLFWFRTTQALLEEWGFVPGAWHLVSRSQFSIIIIGVSAQGQPRRSASGALFAHAETRAPLALLDAELCEFRGPFSAAAVPPPGSSIRLDTPGWEPLAA